MVERSSPPPQPVRAINPDSLGVIGLISGGKDSFYSLLHCLRNGHRIVALGNLYPPASHVRPSEVRGGSDDVSEGKEDGEEDLNSFMYQTVGHTIIPVYERLLGKPLYRQEILGGAVQTGTSYQSPDAPPSPELEAGREEDETESLTLLLKRIMKLHPEANAVCSGAILSTYQRTRIESVALRLGLVPLAYLWQYTVVRPDSQSALLMDMYEAGLEARIVKVASGGLDERSLWSRVTDPKGIAILENKLKKFGLAGDGAVIGEGGEYETLVVDGPISLFKGRVSVDQHDLTTVNEGGGTAWLKIGKFDVALKDEITTPSLECKIPAALDPVFSALSSVLTDWVPTDTIVQQDDTTISFHVGSPNQGISNKTFSSYDLASVSMEEQAQRLVNTIRKFLQIHRLPSTSIIFSHLILPSMSGFLTVNKYYGSLFSSPNPPARVTICCNPGLFQRQPLQIQLTIYKPPPSFSRLLQHKNALHVQSRSYWAPANIGPYSQAISYACLLRKPLAVLPTLDRNDESTDDDDEEELRPTFLVKIAGQIPLEPASMSLPVPRGDAVTQFKTQLVLSLQHLWRVGTAMDVEWFVGSVAYIPSQHSNKDALPAKLCSQLVAKAWGTIHRSPLTHSASDDGSDDDTDLSNTDDQFDVWHAKNNHRNGPDDSQASASSPTKLPDWSLLSANVDSGSGIVTPPVFTAVIESLPRGADIEWHAFTGIGTGATSILPRTYTTNDFTVHNLLTSNFITHTIISIHALDANTSANVATTTLRNHLARALQLLQLSNDGLMKMTSLACVNVNFGDWWDGGDENDVHVVKCRGLWDGNANEVAGFWVLEGML